MTDNGEFDWDPFKGDRVGFDEIGDMFVGQVQKIEVKKGQGGDVPVLTMLEKDSTRLVDIWASQTQLKQRLAEEGVQVGDLLAVKLTELRHTGQPSPMKVFAVKVQKGEAPAPDAVEEIDDSPF